MFNPLNPQFALAGATPTSAAPAPESSTKASVSAMLSGVRGRAMGRGAAPISVSGGHAPHSSEPQPPHGETAPELLDALEAIAGAMGQMQSGMESLRADVSHLKNKGADSERVFNALHGELADYKRDFVFEHIKPLLRPLLFLFDSLDEFDSEMAAYERDQAQIELRPNALRATKVRQNIAFLRDQLVQSLAVCDIEPLPLPDPLARFDAPSQKAVATVPVAPELDGCVQEVRHQGWTLKGHILRPTEVVVGKKSS